MLMWRVMIFVKNSGLTLRLRQSQSLSPRNLCMLQVKLLHMPYLLAVSHISLLDVNLSQFQFNTSLCFGIFLDLDLGLDPYPCNIDHWGVFHLDMSHDMSHNMSHLENLDRSQLKLNPSL